ncbi:MAG: hypothetical protein U5K72_19280 [Balneolaceae bacterium]|nr:hypothetical protein [Balneolaceae bacterium]
MWNIAVIDSSKQNVKFGIHEDGSPISNRYFLELLRDSQPFREFYNGFLADSDYEAFFWENKPITNNNLGDDYECNILNSDFLAGRSPDAQTFKQYFKRGQLVVTFPNLGNDAELIVPCPQKKNDCYTHIGTFVRNADDDQIDEFWRITGRETLKAIGSKPKWLSTSGLGVFWLHVRIDTIPKYYQTKEYKKI